MTGADGKAAHEALRRGELTVLGRIRSASNATFLCEATLDQRVVHCVYKPVAGEQPLWDFPDGTLAGRELGSYLVSTALGWNIVPHTIIRDGPAGRGMLQLWVDQESGDGTEPTDTEPTGTEPTDAESTDTGPARPDLVDLCAPNSVPPGYLSVLRAYDYAGDEVILAHADDPRLKRMAVFDVIINNADRKGGHILVGVDGCVYGVDHGVSLHSEDKLRTVLWGWAGKSIDDETLSAVATLDSRLGASLGEVLREHITVAEVVALRSRVRAILKNPVLPPPDRRRPIPWPAF